jgi:hypothetical protein
MKHTAKKTAPARGRGKRNATSQAVPAPQTLPKSVLAALQAQLRRIEHSMLLLRLEAKRGALQEILEEEQMECEEAGRVGDLEWHQRARIQVRGAWERILDLDGLHLRELSVENKWIGELMKRHEAIPMAQSTIEPSTKPKKNTKI